MRAVWRGFATKERFSDISKVVATQCVATQRWRVVQHSDGVLQHSVLQHSNSVLQHVLQHSNSLL